MRVTEKKKLKKVKMPENRFFVLGVLEDQGVAGRLEGEKRRSIGEQRRFNQYIFAVLIFPRL